MAKCILIIDDEESVVTYLKTFLEDNGYETIVARDGLEALDVVGQKIPDLITLDLQMPKEWGPRFYRKLTKDERFKDIPVIVVSGLDGKYAIKNAVAFVKKPFDREKLLETVKKTIGEA